MRCTLLLELGLTLPQQLLVLLYGVRQGLMRPRSMLQRSFPAGYVLQQRPGSVGHFHRASLRQRVDQA